MRIDFADDKRFNDVQGRLKIMARATAYDKFILISGVKQKGALVGMTGDSIADADALQLADVGLCMGSGCDVAKDNSDLVILDNNFSSIHSSIKWGRAIFENVRKFIQFQLTVNIVLCFITLLSGITLGRTPLNVIQMLWTNLIMDVLGAIAIGTEAYDPNIKASRVSRRAQIIKMEMWRQILMHSAYQIFVMVILMYFGPLIFFEETFNLVLHPKRINGEPTDRLILDTMLFHTFILMSLFNQLNCRIVEADEKNIFKTLNPFKNPIFFMVFGLEIFVQQLMINSAHTTFGSNLLDAGPLDAKMQLIAWILGVSPLLVNLLIKEIELDKFNFTDPEKLKFINLEACDQSEWINKLTAWKDQQLKTLPDNNSSEDLS